VSRKSTAERAAAKRMLLGMMYGMTEHGLLPL
jgi:hypothetical protein